ncbi:MAG: helix-turn-helix transcriptional regulator [Phycisphaeraceae bacterium]
MISAALRNLIDQQLTSVGEIGELAGVAPSTVYRWVNGQTQPPYDSIRLLIRHLPNARAQRVLLLHTIRGTAWQVRGPHASLDVNADGKIDAEDALDTMIRIVSAASQSLEQTRESLRQTPLSQNELMEAVETLEDVAIESCLAQQILAKIHEAHARPPRRQALRPQAQQMRRNI